MGRRGLPASFHTGFSHWWAARPRRHSHLCAPERSAALGMTKMVSVQSTLCWWMHCPTAGSFKELCCFVLFFFSCGDQLCHSCCWPLAPVRPQCLHNPLTPPRQTHPKVMKYPLPGRAEPLKMPAEWENTHCLVQGRFLWGEALKGDGCRDDADAALRPVSAEWADTESSLKEQMPKHSEEIWFRGVL